MTNKFVKKTVDSIWVDEIEGMTLTNKTADSVAKMVGGSVIVNGQPFVTVPTPRGEILIREGDFVGKDQNGKWHLVRLKDISSKTNENVTAVKNVKPSPMDLAKKKRA